MMEKFEAFIMGCMFGIIAFMPVFMVGVLWYLTFTLELNIFELVLTLFADVVFTCVIAWVEYQLIHELRNL